MTGSVPDDGFLWVGVSRRTLRGRLWFFGGIALMGARARIGSRCPARRAPGASGLVLVLASGGSCWAARGRSRPAFVAFRVRAVRLRSSWPAGEGVLLTVGGVRVAAGPSLADALLPVA